MSMIFAPLSQATATFIVDSPCETWLQYLQRCKTPSLVDQSTFFQGQPPRRMVYDIYGDCALFNINIISPKCARKVNYSIFIVII